MTQDKPDSTKVELWEAIGDEIPERKHAAPDLEECLTKKIERIEHDLRFGLENGAPLAPAAVAAACGRSKDWVRRCEMRAIRKLRKPHHLMALRPYNAQREALLSGSHSA